MISNKDILFIEKKYRYLRGMASGYVLNIFIDSSSHPSEIWVSS